MNNDSILKPLALLAVIAIILFAVYLMMQPGVEGTIGEDVPDEAPTVQIYDSAAYGLRFSYPESYVLTEHDAGSGERTHHTIVLMDSTAAANLPIGGEGPPAISIDIFGNDIDALPVEAWIKNTSASNYKLSTDQTLTPATVGGSAGLSYTWDGLYRGESTVIAHGDNILMLSGTYMDSTDAIRTDFSELLRTVQLR